MFGYLSTQHEIFMQQPASLCLFDLICLSSWTHSELIVCGKNNTVGLNTVGNLLINMKRKLDRVILHETFNRNGLRINLPLNKIEWTTDLN